MYPRLDSIRRRTREAGADAAVILHPPHLRWSVGFTGSNGALFVTADAAHFVTDGRYDTQARAEVEGAEVHVPGYALFEHVVEHRLTGEARRLALDADRTPIGTFDRLKVLFPNVEIVPVPSLLDQETGAKTEDEIERLRAAQALTAEVFNDLLPLLQPGVREQDVAAEIVYQHLRKGAERMSFEPIVASGPRGALPHAHPSSRTFRPGELVVLDFGGVLDGYAADLTRTVAIGEPGEEARRVYDAVRRAQVAGKAAIEPGISGRDVDTAARVVLEDEGLGAYFSHGLGHGIGLETHEWPRLSQRADDLLPLGAAVTVEPGAYLPERFGVRIEDVVVVREGGGQTLTPLPTDLLVL